VPQDSPEDENPWRRLPAGPPYFLPEDEILLREFNASAGPDSDYFLHTDEILPEAFVGTRDAPVVLLSNNPGYSEEEVTFKQEAGFVAKLRNNLLHGRSDYPFLFLAPDFGGGGKKWWVRVLKQLLKQFGDQVVARSILNVPTPVRRDDCCGGDFDTGWHAPPGGRPRKTDVREVVNALFYLNREGCSWRALPHDFPPWRTVSNYFNAAPRQGLDQFRRRVALLRRPGQALVEGRPFPAPPGLISRWA
jgi:hypothetical protein